MRKQFVPGQRWLSETEPELGLGMVLNASTHQVTVVFRATGTTRQYSIESAPLKRVTFRVGESVRGEKDQEFKVTEVTEQDGLVVYLSNGAQIPETLLSDHVALNAPRERLLAGNITPSAAFDLRYRAVQLHHEMRKSPVRGFTGGRIGLIPHQLYIATEVTARLNPRVLLADEVGLGKTIESCLILHRLLLTGRVQRALILVPESLVHQWFIELLRRFNLWFSIFDEERCAAIEAHEHSANPFQDDQLVIASIGLLAQKESRATQAVEAGWDILIVDEAHHLEWSPDLPSVEYRIVEALARKVPSVLLLTATPEQLGEASHFARLRLLDPERFSDLERFLEEQMHYEKLAIVAGNLLSGEALSEDQKGVLGKILGTVPTESFASEEGRKALVKRLLDQHGTGRVMFRNTRAAMAGFPKRIANLVPLEGSDDEEFRELLQAEFETDADPSGPKPDYDFDDDPRIIWLAEFLRTNPDAKVLLLCRYREKVEMIEGAIRGRINVKTAMFHEKLPLVQRDRNAVYFAEEDGARVLICSEIGSEGRNFQFAHHLVLFDLPLNPELLEQRIGRLDRIGQTEDIKIHVPYVTGSPLEMLARWYHEGVNAFARHFSGGAEMGQKFGERVLEVALEETPEKDFAKLLKETKKFREELEAKLHSGRDRLLELNSFDTTRASAIVQQIATADADTRLDQFVTDAFDHFGLNIEDVGNRTFNLGGGDLFHDKIPALPEEGLTATADRARALGRESVGFLTWDHPIVTSVLDMLLGSEAGNSSFALWPGAPEAGVLVEAVYVLETQAPEALHLDRFLPPTPLRIVLNHKRKELGVEAAPEVLATGLKEGDAAVLAAQMEEFGTLIPGMMRVTEIIAGKQSKPIIEAATARAKEVLGGEVTRLEQLRAQNPSVRLDEIEAAKKDLEQLLEN
ncbi:MAG TPA: RNA polymerase-associated protein RapA, partial [Candidatus Kapabacteria bacterium]|nr:RNA polymerase-associated protein RapA [Candidatus Kapabacteria bacterium]